MRLLLWVGRGLLCATPLVGVVAASPACYSAGSGTAPPPNQFYFPVGLAVSAGGRVLYAVNSDFDLQWNGGTLQSYDLTHVRTDAAALVDYNVFGTASVGGISFVSGGKGHAPKPCVFKNNGAITSGVPLGQACAPPIDSTSYFQQSVVVGAFATDLQLMTPLVPTTTDRLFFPVRGTATLTFRDVRHDDPSHDPSQPVDFSMTCSPANDGCAVGSNPNSTGNSRRVTMPGEPFGMALSQDRTVVTVTHQTDTKTSLLTSSSPNNGNPPTMQFVLDGVPVGGNGIVAVPHDYDAVTACDDPRHPGNANCLRPAFLQTSRSVAEIDLLRYYSDSGIPFGPGVPGEGVSLQRPYIQRERAYSLTANSIGTDSRGIVIDPTPRLACKAALGPLSNPPTADQQAALQNCGRRPARVFFANRTPPSLVFGEIGETASDGSYDADQLVISGQAPVDVGASRVYVAPILDRDGHFEMRVFVVCFDSADVFVFDPEFLGSGQNSTPEQVIYTGAGTGPFAMAFDPMPLECAAIGDPTSAAWKAMPGDPAYPWRTTPCPPNPSQVPSSGVGPYRFGYIANFTQSFVQMIDLDASSPSAPYTFEQIVFTLGNPTLPKGQ
jgi:hypothetical protein